MAGALVVYYSRKGENHMPGGIQVLEKGNTAFAAEFVAQAVDADLFEIDTVTPYAENYRECCGQAIAEAKAKARPAPPSRASWRIWSSTTPSSCASPTGAARLRCVCSLFWSIMI